MNDKPINANFQINIFLNLYFEVKAKNAGYR